MFHCVTMCSCAQPWRLVFELLIVTWARSIEDFSIHWSCGPVHHHKEGLYWIEDFSIHWSWPCSSSWSLDSFLEPPLPNGSPQRHQKDQAQGEGDADSHGVSIMLYPFISPMVQVQICICYWFLDWHSVLFSLHSSWIAIQSFSFLVSFIQGFVLSSCWFVFILILFSVFED